MINERQDVAISLPFLWMDRAFLAFEGCASTREVILICDAETLDVSVQDGCGRDCNWLELSLWKGRNGTWILVVSASPIALSADAHLARAATIRLTPQSAQARGRTQTINLLQKGLES